MKNSPNFSGVAVITVAAALGVSFSCGAQTGPGAAVATERNLQVQAAAATTSSATSTQRVALVVGNSSYKEGPLANPVNDARAIAQALRESGFSVTIRENTDQRTMLSALREFGDRLRAGGTGLFYYAGHGMQIKGRNYLIPVGISIEREDEVAYNAVDAQAVLDKMEAAGNPANIMILDACRNNPFVRNTRSGQAGLAQMDAPVGTLVAYATAPGSVASDGNGANGLYTQHLLAAIRQPGNKVEDVFKQVRSNVRRDSQGRQVPWESTSLEGDFYFRGAPVVAPPVDTAAALEAALWDAVKGSSLPIEVRAYLNRYPSGKFALEARARLAQLQVPATPVAAIPAPAPIVAPSIAVVSVPVAVVKPAPVGDARPVVAQNSPGFSVGDRWRYQVVDKYKGEVVRNVGYKVDKLLLNGDMTWNGGAITTSPEGNFRRDVTASVPERDYSPQMDLVPKELRVGYRQPVDFVITVKRKDDFAFKEEYKGTLVVKEREKIKVPAGEFDAYRIERDTQFTGFQTNGGARWYGRDLVVGWYVPELHFFAAMDFEHRTGSQPANRERAELTSFVVRTADRQAAR